MDIPSRNPARRAVTIALLSADFSWRTLFAAAFWPIAFVVTSCVLVATARLGADLPRYEAWGNALFRGDIFQLHSLVGSPMGLPLSVHSAGPGMLLSVGRAWFGWLGLPVRPDYLFMGLATLCSWWTLLRLLLRLTNGNVPVSALVLGLGFLGTHLGYYSWAYSSESASFFSLGILYYFAIVPERVGLLEAALIGIASGLAVMIRAQLAIYVALPCIVAGYRVYRASGLGWRSASLVLIAAVPCLTLIGETAFINRWMTGSFLRTPYQFGDAQWQSVDWRHPEFGAVLAHPRHGLLTYHPLYLVGFGCAIYVLATARDWAERSMAGATIVIPLLHLYLQAAWFCWWLGTWTFGMRGMAPAALLVLPALAVALDRRQRVGRRVWPIVAVCIACALWSSLLYLQAETNFNTWPELVEHQRAMLDDPMVLWPIVSVTVGVVAYWLGRGRASGVALVAAAGVVDALAIGVAAHAGVERWLLKDPGLSVAKAGAAWAGILGLLAVGTCAALAWHMLARPAYRATELVVGGLVIALVISGTFQFQRLARNTEAFLTKRAPAPHHFEVTSAVLWDEIEASYEEYQAIPGFDAAKARFLAYLERHNDEWAFVRRLHPPQPQAHRRRTRAR